MVRWLGCASGRLTITAAVCVPPTVAGWPFEGGRERPVEPRPRRFPVGVAEVAHDCDAQPRPGRPFSGVVELLQVAGDQPRPRRAGSRLVEESLLLRDQPR